MDKYKKNQRYVMRSDMTTRLTHLTKPESGKIEDDEDAFNRLWEILLSSKIKANKIKHSPNMSWSEQPVVCFQDAPLVNIAENLKYERKIQNNKARYSAFGIRMLKKDIIERGGRPVIYDTVKNAQEMKKRQEKDLWRIVTFKYDEENDYYIDWMHEREWRVPDDIYFDYSEIEVIVKSPKYYQKLINRCIDNDKTDILREIKGIVVLNSVYA